MSDSEANVPVHVKLDSPPRIVSRAADREEGDPSHRPASRRDDGDRAAAGTEPFLYEVTGVPPGCTTYELGDYIDVFLTPPPPQDVMILMSGPCNELIATLVV